MLKIIVRLKNIVILPLAIVANVGFSEPQIISDKPLKLITNPTTDNQSLYAASLASGGVRVPNGQIAINEEFLAVAATPEDISSFTQAGFYFLTYGKTPHGLIPLELDVQRGATFQSIKREIRAQINFDLPRTRCNTENECEPRYALVWNYEFEGLDDEIVLSQFVNTETRQLEIMTSRPVLRIDAHLEFSGTEYNFQLFPSGEKYVADLHPEIGNSSGPTAFSVYYTSIDEESRSHETEKMFYFSGASFSMNIQKGYNLFNENSRDIRFNPLKKSKTNQVYIHYSIEEQSSNFRPSQYNYIMERDSTGEFVYSIPEFVGVEEGNIVSFYTTYDIDGIFYDSHVKSVNFTYSTSGDSH